MKNIVLLGFMGTGKSVVGRHLAAELRYQFVDTDQMIEEKTGKKISEIFVQQGEAQFRAWEAEAVREVSDRNRCVISTGGGIVLNAENLEALSRKGVLISLQARPEVILKRVQKRAGQRPLLQKPDPLSEIQRLLSEREPFYRRASFMIDTSDMRLEEVVRQIKEKILKGEDQEDTSSTGSQ
jgi:shikimate kinase